MTTKDSTVVRLPTRLVVAIDERRGPLSRAEYLARVVDRALGTETAAASTERPDPTRVARGSLVGVGRVEVTPRFKKGKAG